eukprot:TRINITY_DN4088_c0_g1_i1.p1 TRINITY_DN4088_c0_g1~~TRINITY_DN4088_c0_g1_i1.p1  ORF type:complete len:248 (+),score=22.79 TRINITY_DN4088_c0_g1_i1:90-833(+)
MQLRGLIVFVLLIVVQCKNNNVPYYTFGDKQLYRDEGRGVASVSGQEPLQYVSSFDCAQSCLSLKNECDCCDSFTYNTFTRDCYLKKRSPDASIDTSFNNAGFQTYTFTNEPGSTIEDEINSLQFNLRGESSAYVHKGFGQLAQNEGETLPNFDNKQFLSNVRPADCAVACNRVGACNSFSYNPNRYGGTCFLKKTADQISQPTITSPQGWTTYWKQSPVNKKDCFCSCENNTYCILCFFDTLCQER